MGGQRQVRKVNNKELRKEEEGKKGKKARMERKGNKEGK